MARPSTPSSRLRQLAAFRGVNGVGSGGGAAGWTPADLPDIVVDVRRTSTQWTDNLVTPATATDDRVYKWRNETGGADGVAFNTGTERLFRTAVGGVRGNGVARNFLFSGLGGTTGNFTVAARVRMTGAVFGNPGWMSAPWSDNARFYHSGSNNIAYFDDVIGGNYPLFTCVTGTFFTVAIRRTAGSVQVKAGNSVWTTVGAYALAVSSFNISTIAGGGMESSMEVTDVESGTAAWTTELDDLEAYWGA